MSECPNYIRKAEGNRTIYVEMAIWYNEDNGSIHMTIPNSGWFHTTVHTKSELKRGHPNLFKGLAKLLKEANVEFQPDFIKQVKIPIDTKKPIKRS
ncbi:MAG: hypothetical protein OXE94_15430 [Aestuariivita sp.]|nr:hypothetical protein [Aestuariivita sp.]